MNSHEDRLSTRQTAERLGVKPETVYAYVSRGLLTSHKSPGSRGSTFDAKEVDALARRHSRPVATGAGTDGVAPGTTTIRTGITLIDRDRYFFRGVDATALATAYPYEEAADWLWTGRITPGLRFTAPEELLSATTAAVAALPAHAGPVDRLRAAAVAAAAADPLRFDLSAESVHAAARGLIAAFAGSPPVIGRTHRADAPIARRLWARLSPARPEPAALRVLDTALVLLIDHDLAASTLAARVAASARANPYAVVSTGLSALDGPLHGAASGLAHRMLLDVLERGAAPVVSEHFRAGHRVPGLGHRLYPGEDPRAQVLFALLDEVPGARGALDAAQDVVEISARHTPLHANVDLALAVLSVTAGMPAEAGETVFAVARTAGWIAHALEEYEERPLRMRPSGSYAGPRPPQPLP
ncbi:Citrate synthase 2 [Streptomyces sp. RB5]|uniref:citrate synthase (unknown stereospecificity) n=1 Tax=Streptomyces smaragdinus TaxID=2585196 RepID=A0A7K0CEP5_9ACTN|nr:citrate synthase [Streptomyces smaragdinus]MQY11823.1 Citrate synthase 2 [Streptomyces smaragdinus]